MLINFLRSHEALNVKSILSHLAASESEEHQDYTLNQVQLFEKIASQISESLGYSITKHIANTAAISKWPEAQFDMVRLGIGLYGLASLASEKTVLQNVATLKTTITQIKNLKKGDTVGYGRSGVMQRDGKIAIVKIGYADGYPRALGNGLGAMSINGNLVPTIGHICMDMCMLDVTDIEVNEGDDVNVFGEEISIYDLAKQLNTIPYEIISNLSQRIKRVYFYE
jgi:alanine racemase